VQLRAGYTITLAGNRIQYVEPASQRGSGRNGNKVVASAASEAFARWLHYRRAPVETPTAGHNVSPRDILLRPRRSVTFLLGAPCKNLLTYLLTCTTSRSRQILKKVNSVFKSDGSINSRHMQFNAVVSCAIYCTQLLQGAKIIAQLF